MHAAMQNSSASLVGRLGCGTLGATAMAGGPGGAPTVCSVPAAFVAEGGGQPLSPCMEMLDGVGLTTTILGFLEVMRVMVFVRNEQMPLKRPQNPKTAPRLRGPCQLIPTPREGWKLPKLNSLFISPGFLRVTLPLFLVCL